MTRDRGAVMRQEDVHHTSASSEVRRGPRIKHGQKTRWQPPHHGPPWKMETCFLSFFTCGHLRPNSWWFRFDPYPHTLPKPVGRSRSPQKQSEESFPCPPLRKNERMSLPMDDIFFIFTFRTKNASCEMSAWKISSSKAQRHGNCN